MTSQAMQCSFLQRAHQASRPRLLILKSSLPYSSHVTRVSVLLLAAILAFFHLVEIDDLVAAFEVKQVMQLRHHGKHLAVIECDQAVWIDGAIGFLFIAFSRVPRARFAVIPSQEK